MCSVAIFIWLRPEAAICILHAYTIHMNFVWDPKKARSNAKKHGVRFFDTEMVLFDPNSLTREDVIADGEQRFVTGGMDPL